MQAFSACFMKFCVALNSYKCIKNYPYPQWIDDQQIVSTSSTALRFGRHGASAALPTAMTAMMFSSSGMERSLRDGVGIADAHDKC